MISPITMYTSVRQEILDQKKCQFHLFGACITLTAAVLAYAAATKVGPLVYLAPILLNLMGVIIILDKAISINRMVGYLQLMENEHDKHNWMWEYHLSKYRELTGKPCGIEGFRRHSYVITVAAMLLVMNLLCLALYFWGPAATIIRNSSQWASSAEFYGAVDLLMILLVGLSLLITVRRWCQLMFGKFTGKAIRKRWLEAIE